MKLSTPNRKVLFLGGKNIQCRLIQREISVCSSAEVTHKSRTELKLISQLNDYDIVLIDFSCMAEEEYSFIPTINTLSFGLIIYNVPNDTPSEHFLSWSCLKGILFEGSPIEHIGKSVESVLSGEMWLPRQYMEAMLSHYRSYTVPHDSPFDDLTRREKQILDRLVCGQTNQEIADELFVAESTVKTHIYKLYKKINVHCRREAIKLVRSVK